MADVERERRDWNVSMVEADLIAAFRAMPALPVFANIPRLTSAEGEGDRKPGSSRTRFSDIRTVVANWTAFLEGDEVGRKCLWAWARCRATGQSFGEVCRIMGWPRASAEVARRRAAAAIAAGLMRELDR